MRTASAASAASPLDAKRSDNEAHRTTTHDKCWMCDRVLPIWEMGGRGMCCVCERNEYDDRGGQQ